jgi:hypothetical protein
MAPVGSHRATAAIDDDDDSDGLARITLRFYLGSSLAFCSASSVRSSLMNEMSYLGSVSRRRGISMSVSQRIPVGHRLRLR